MVFTTESVSPGAIDVELVLYPSANLPRRSGALKWVIAPTAVMVLEVVGGNDPTKQVPALKTDDGNEKFLVVVSYVGFI